MSTTTTPTVDLAAVKARQQAAWASGDYARVAARIPVVSELLCDRAGLEAGARVLDVAAGSGNTSIAAARQGCEVVGIDYVPELLARARRRAEAEGLPVELVEADAERLPFADGSFDAVVSVFGAMFAPDQPAAAAELVDAIWGEVEGVDATGHLNVVVSRLRKKLGEDPRTGESPIETVRGYGYRLSTRHEEPPA